MTLKTQMVTDLSNMMNTDEFDEMITYTPSGGAAKAIKGNFSDSYLAVSNVTGEVEETKPQALVISTDITGAAHGDTMLINSVTYKIKGPPQADDSGLTTVVLSID